MRNYTKIQKSISFLLIFSLLFSMTIHISFFSFVGKIFAGNVENFKVVAILVQEDLYGKIDDEVKRYARDIQQVLPETKTMIIPVSSQEHPYNIASLLEKLYFEGYQGIAGLSGESKLIGSVFVGDIALPVVENQGKYEKTIFPYTDFEDKVYVYDTQEKKYKFSTQFSGSPKAEIWHGFISPNTGNISKDAENIITYFDKNHDFYTAAGVYSDAKNVMNGNNTGVNENYEPYVFYYDQIREFQALNYVNYKAYEQYNVHKEDLVYDRYSKDLANVLKEEYSKNQNQELSGLESILGGVDISGSDTLDTKNVPDILTRHVISNSVKKFPQVFNPDALGQFRKDVHNAGRYNTGSTGVNVDLIPQMIGQMDSFAESVIKNVNTDLEKEIDTIVKNGLSRKMAVLTDMNLKTNSCGGETYVNFFYGTQASNISSAQECSFYRGNNANSGTLVQSNRAFNLDLVQKDAELCTDKTQGYWGGNSPLNIDRNTFSSMQYKLNFSYPERSIVPLYDVKGQVKSQDNSKLQSPLDCYENGLILVRKDESRGLGLGCRVDYEVPYLTNNSKSWSCETINTLGSFSSNFDQVYGQSCSGKSVTLDGKQVCGNSDDDSYVFKSISSVVEHKSPTQEELIEQIKNQKTPNLAIDKNRYVDFIDIKGGYQKIEYPFLFRLKTGSGVDLSLGNIDVLLQDVLNQKSSEINTMISQTQPVSLSGKQKELYNLLKTGAFPSANIDLYKNISEKSSQKISIFSESKELKYLDVLKLALYWNNLPSASAKYKFIFEYQLGDQMMQKDFSFFLPKNKSLYEMSYINAPGDGVNMFVKMDGEDKGVNPYANLISKNLELQSSLQLIDKNTAGDDGSTFKCSPPDGVPLQEWLPAVQCWLEDMMPPKIGIEAGSCGGNDVFDFENSDFFDRYEGEGMLDFLTSEFYGGYIRVFSDTPRCGYNKSSNIKVQAYNKDGNLLAFDNYSQVKFDIARVEVPRDINLPLSFSNSKIIYDDTFEYGSDLFSDQARKEVAKYIEVKESTLRLKGGEATLTYTSKNKDVNVTFRVRLELRDAEGQSVLNKNATFDLQIRGDSLNSVFQHISNFGGQTIQTSGISSVAASDKTNLYVSSLANFQKYSQNLSALQNLSGSPEKLFVVLQNQTAKGQNLPLELPVQIMVSKDNKILRSFEYGDETKIIDVGNYSQSGKYHLTLIDRYGQKFEKDWFVGSSEVEKIDLQLSTNLMEKGAVVTPHVFLLQDVFGNMATGKNITVEAQISGNSVTFEDGTTTKVFQVFEGMKKFNLKTTQNTGKSEIIFTVKRNEKQNLTLKAPIEVVDEIKFDVVLGGNALKVGGKKYNYSLQLQSPFAGTSFSSQAFLVTDALYLTSKDAYVSIQNNQGSGTLFTTNRASEKLRLEWRVQGVKNTIVKEIMVLPDLPIRVGLTLDKSRLQASSQSVTQLKAELKDRYGNTVFNDNSSSFQVEVDEKYQSIVSFPQTQKTAQKGKTSFVLRATDTPGTAYFKVKTSPSLEQNIVSLAGQTEFLKSELSISGFKNSNGTLSNLGNSFFYEYDSSSYRSKFSSIDQLQGSQDYKNLSSGQKSQLLKLYNEKNMISLKGISENVGKIETFYYWNANELQNTYHNSLYATLLGGGYGDITQKDALGNALLFEETSKTLAVTSLLSQQQNTQDVLQLSSAGNISIHQQGNDLVQNISENARVTPEGNLEFTFLNTTLGLLAGQVHLNFTPNNLLLQNCTTPNFESCFDAQKTSAILYTYSGDAIYKSSDSAITLEDFAGKNIFSLSKTGKIELASFAEIKINPNYKKYLGLDIRVNGTTIATLAIQMKQSQISVIRDISQLEGAKSYQTKGGMVLFLDTLDYSYKRIYAGSSTKENSGISVVYNDPFAGETNKKGPFLNAFPSGYEQSIGEKGLGWSEENKTLLSFAGGKNVGGATKDFASFSLINLGDPVISLKPITKQLLNASTKRKFDPTLGALVSKDSTNIAFNTFDYNNDGKTDIAILKQGGFIELLEGNNDIYNFISRGNLLHFADYSDAKVIETGDFTGDKFEDIVVLNKNGELVMFNNTNKNFTRRDLSKELGLKSRIMQVYAFDMDNDGKTDLVTYNQAGDVHILYGAGVSEEPKFTKKLVKSGWGTKLSTTLRSDGGLVYFSGMYQLPPSREMYVLQSSEELQAQVDKNVANLLANPASNPFQNATKSLNESLIDNLLFRNINYQHPTENIIPSNLQEYEQIASQNSDTITTFLKSEYAPTQGLKVEKRFTDLNSETLQTGDDVILEVKVQNTTASLKNNVVYLEKLPDVFERDTTKLAELQVDGRNLSGSGVMLKRSSSSEYPILLDMYNYAGREYPISLSPGESFVLKVPLKTKAFQAGYMEVGLFEKGESGDDAYGDIAFKMKDQSCALPYTLLRSNGSRSYIEGEKEMVCEKDLPDDIAQNLKDDDKNGIPDYIDKLISDGKAQNKSYEQYAKEGLDALLLDSDGDGIPDDEDESPYYDDSEDFMSELDALNTRVDELVAGIDDFMDGLSCGFGGGACLSLPMNRAPLAPGNDPVLFGMPIGDGLHPYEGIPTFSAVTACGLVPGVWPPCPTGAGGVFGYAPGPYRLFITPTLTGAVGVAMCFGDNTAAGYSPAPGVSPLTPGGNCIVLAKPFLGCKNDGSDGEIYNVALSMVNANGFSAINGNCDGTSRDTTSAIEIPESLATDYIRYKQSGYKSESLLDGFDSVLKQGYQNQNNYQYSPDSPLFTFAEGNSGSEFSLTLDNSSTRSSDFSDVVDIQMERIGAFPDFLMDWVRRQIEEIVNKLTSFPTLFVVLPDFSGVFEGFENFSQNFEASYDAGVEERTNKEENYSQRIDALKEQKSQLNCESEEDKVNCLYYDIQIANFEREKNYNGSQVMSGIRGVYEFLGSLPMISITPETVNVNVPWIDESTLNKAILEWELTSSQWKDEWQRVKTSGGWNQYNCLGTPSDSEECRVIVDIENLISSLDRNIAVLKTYKEFPERLNEMIRIKELRLEQILCNVEILSEVLGGWISDNGKRFRAWVELYVLVKAVLKSWQVFIDIFLDYEAECYQCKNERNDLQYFTWKLISGVIPSMPIIQFPKWPDIYLDFHNIRVGVQVAIPDFHFNLRPILLPTLPNLYLPDAPYVNLKVPNLPILPEYELPELPDLPSLPVIELPDLPPPPKLPKLFGSLEGFLNILKLITKAMCILKFNPFVPEWRAGDQIAYMTERSGYLATDFIDISLPQFSYPVVDAIKVTTWVNLEYESEFLTEAARQAVLPLNVFTNNVVNYLNIGVDDVDLTRQFPSEINVEVDENAESDVDFGYSPDKKGISVLDFAMMLASRFPSLHKAIEAQSQEQLSNTDFKQYVNKNLSTLTKTFPKEGEKLQTIWSEANNYSFEKEDALIAELEKNREQKMTRFESVLKEQIQKTRSEKTQLQTLLSKQPKQNTLIGTQSDKKAYENLFTQTNTATLEAAVKLTKPDQEVGDIRSQAGNISKQIDVGLGVFEKQIQASDVQTKAEFQKAQSTLLAINSTIEAPSIGPVFSSTSTTSASSVSSEQSCKLSSGAGYAYKGIYIVEEFLGKNMSYRLFDYIDELTGKEKVVSRDIDGDGDDDAVYMMNGEIYIKQNLFNPLKTFHYDGSPIVVDFDDTEFASDDFVSGVNYFEENVAESGFINFSFAQSNDTNVSNYRIGMYEIVDGFAYEASNFASSYIPQNTKKRIIDALSDINSKIKIESTTQNQYLSRSKNIAYIDTIGNLGGVEMYTKELENIGTKLSEGKQVIINAGTPVYAGNSDVSMVFVPYAQSNQNDALQKAVVSKYEAITFQQDVILKTVSSDVFIQGPGYVTLRGNQIIPYVKKPLFPGTKIEYKPNEKNISSGIVSMTIQTYDGNILPLDFERIVSYEIYDLGAKNDTYNVRISQENDFYSAQIQAFSGKNESTLSQNVLLSPQIQADNQAPSIEGLKSIKVPVYQKVEKDITDFIYENSGVTNIKNIFIDFDLTLDSSGDGNTFNDPDMYLGGNNPLLKITNFARSVKLEFGPFDELFTRKIRLYVVDQNNNMGYKDIDFEVYAPTPNISRISGSLIEGKIDEKLQEEPVHLYRLRGGSLSRLSTKQNETSVSTDKNGNFTFITGKNEKGVILTQNDQKVAEINEDTGKISLEKFTNLDINIFPSGDTRNTSAYPKMVLQRNGVPLYEQFISLPNAESVENVVDFANVVQKQKPGMFVKMTSGAYQNYVLPYGISQNAGDMVIYNVNDKYKTPVFTLFKDGRITVQNNSYSLEYTSFDNYVVYKLLQGNTEIARVMLIPEGEYVVE